MSTEETSVAESMHGEADDVIVSNGKLRLRLMRDEDDEYARISEWRNQPHVREWWEPDEGPMTVEIARAECRPCIVGDETDHLAIIEVETIPIGFVAYYPWQAYADELESLGLTVPDGAWGLDLYIGEPAYVNRGIGSRTVRMLFDYLCMHEGATAVALGVERANTRALRAYQKAGMREVRSYLDTDTRDGRRVPALFLLRSVDSRIS